MFLLSCVGIHSLPPSLTSMRLSHLQHIKALSCVSSSPNHPSLFHSSHFHSNHSTRFAWSLNDINEGMSYNKFGIHLHIAIRFFFICFLILRMTDVTVLALRSGAHLFPAPRVASRNPHLSERARRRVKFFQSRRRRRSGRRRSHQWRLPAAGPGRGQIIYLSVS